MLFCGPSHPNACQPALGLSIPASLRISSLRQEGQLRLSLGASCARAKLIAVLLVFIIIAGPIPAVLGEVGSRYLYISTYTFENRGDEAFNLTEDEATIVLFQNNNWQTVRIYNSTHAVAPPYIDIDGNRQAVLNLPSKIPPRSNFTFSVVYEIESSDRPKPEIDPAEAGPLSSIPPRLVEEFCVETETFTTRDEEIQALAWRLAADEASALGMVNRLLEWFIENVSYGTRDVPRYPNETLAAWLGDCDDQAILLITMCRALGIPAILQVGAVFHEGIESEQSSWGGHLYIEQQGVGWHGWALVYIPPWGWLPIEMTMLKSRDSLTRITEAPEYERHIVTCFNVSRHEYVGDSRRSQERLMSSDLYITVSYMLIEESSYARRTTTPYLILGLSIGSVGLAVIIFVMRRRTRIVGENII